jgi:hypothetical protein
MIYSVRWLLHMHYSSVLGAALSPSGLLEGATSVVLLAAAAVLCSCTPAGCDCTATQFINKQWAF